MRKNSICVVGAGKWGKNHIRTLLSNNISVGCVEVDENRLEKILPDIDILIIPGGNYNEWSNILVKTKSKLDSGCFKL